MSAWFVPRGHTTNTVDSDGTIRTKWIAEGVDERCARLDAAKGRAASLRPKRPGRTKASRNLFALYAALDGHGTLYAMTEFHWQLRGPGLLVDWWPTARRGQAIVGKFRINGGDVLEGGIDKLVARLEADGGAP